MRTVGQVLTSPDRRIQTPSQSEPHRFRILRLTPLSSDPLSSILIQQQVHSRVRNLVSACVREVVFQRNRGSRFSGFSFPRTVDRPGLAGGQQPGRPGARTLDGRGAPGAALLGALQPSLRADPGGRLGGNLGPGAMAWAGWVEVTSDTPGSDTPGSDNPHLYLMFVFHDASHV